MKHNTSVHLYDIQESGKYILEFTRNLSLANYCENELIKAAVERKFAIIGEALVRIRQDDPAVLTRLSDSEKIIGFRNILVHGYDAIDHKTVWSAIHDNLPILIEETETLLNE